MMEEAPAEQTGPSLAENSELPTITFNIQPDVGLQLSTPWQEDSEDVDGQKAGSFSIVGPPAVAAFLERTCPGGAAVVRGTHSPPVPVTIHDIRERKAKGIPLECSTFCYCYPLDALAGKYGQLVAQEGRCEPWLFFLLFGGYCYFDALRRPVRTNAVVITPARGRLTFAGPYSPSAGALEHLRRMERFRPVTLQQLLDNGFRTLAWVNPCERPGGHALLADGTDAAAGCFLYSTDDDVCVCYTLVTKQEKKAMQKADAQKLEGNGITGRRFSVVARTTAHLRFLESMVHVAAAADLAAAAATRLKQDVDLWRRTKVEQWLRSHGVAIVSYYALGVVAYGFFEGWTVLDSVYYLTATATTNGDEIVPRTSPGKCFSTLYIILGITVIFRGLSPLAAFLLEWLQRRLLGPLSHRLAARVERVLHSIEDVADSVDARAARWPEWLHPISGMVSNSMRHMAQWVHLEDTNVGLGMRRSRQKDADSSEKRAASQARLSRQISIGSRQRTEMRQKAVRLALEDYLKALLLVVVVALLGMLLATVVHGYSLVDALYWTIGCMTTAGGDLRADTDMLKALYIVYMPLGAVTMLTAALTFRQASLRREIRTDNYELKVHGLLQQEARARGGDRHVTMREADFIIAVLRSRDLIDTETVDAIRVQFAALVRRDVTNVREAASEPAIDAELVFRHLLRQRRVVPKDIDRVQGGAVYHDGTELAHVDMGAQDEGFTEWFETVWSPSITQADTTRSATTVKAEGQYVRLNEQAAMPTEEAHPLTC